MKLADSPCAVVARTVILAALGGVSATAVLAGLAVMPQSASALPTYADKERKDCGYCHVNPAGGSVLNAKGREYQTNGRKFKSPPG
jgi:hypothetical protein